MNRLFFVFSAAMLASLSTSPALGNGFFNGPITSGDAVSGLLSRESRLEDLIRSHDFCATETFKDVYRQLYPFDGEVIVTLGQDRVSGPITRSPEPGFFFSIGRNRYLLGFFIIGPKDGALNPDFPPQLVFSLNGDFFDRALGSGSPDAAGQGKVRVARFDSNSEITLEAAFPSLEFDYERRTSGFDELGNEINPRYLVDNVRVSADAVTRPDVPFKNFVTNQPTSVTLNSDALVECLATRTSTARFDE
jgi:hypothetical protein